VLAFTTLSRRKFTDKITKIRVGMSVGHSTDSAAYTADMKKVNPTNEEKQDAKRRIEGSLAPSAGTDAVPPEIAH
jgi:phosphatidylserine decarboxylase